jgi:hypothetical protein
MRYGDYASLYHRTPFLWFKYGFAWVSVFRNYLTIVTVFQTAAHILCANHPCFKKEPTQGRAAHVAMSAQICFIVPFKKEPTQEQAAHKTMFIPFASLVLFKKEPTQGARSIQDNV